MGEDQISEQFRELLAQLQVGASLAYQLAAGTLKLSWSAFVFIISCGGLQRWRRAAVEDPPVLSDSSLSFTYETPTDGAFPVKTELAPSIAPSGSRDILHKLIQENEFGHRESWVKKTNCREDIIVVPSLSLPQSQLSRMQAMPVYEERQMCLLFSLSNPGVRLVYITSMPVDKAIVDYYLTLLEQNSMVSLRNSYSRLTLLSCNDNSVAPLSAKMLRRPKLLQKIHRQVSPQNSHMVCLISSNLERELAIQLGVPLFANDPALGYWGTVSGARQAFGQSGVPFIKGGELCRSVDALEQAMQSLDGPLVLKLNLQESSNAYIPCRGSMLDSIASASFSDPQETWESFSQKVPIYGCIVEEMIENVRARVSCQGLINPKGQVELLSSHEATAEGQAFPCREEFRDTISERCVAVGEFLSSKGCRERYSVSFLIASDVFASSIKLGWGELSHSLVTAMNLTDSELTSEGLLLAADDQHKYYVTTDNVQNDIFCGLNPEDFLEFVNTKPELQFESENMTGVVFHLLSAISVYGRFGFVAIENSPEKAMDLFKLTIKTLEAEASAVNSNKNFTDLDLSVVPPSS